MYVHGLIDNTLLVIVVLVNHYSNFSIATTSTTGQFIQNYSASSNIEQIQTMRHACLANSDNAYGWPFTTDIASSQLSCRFVLHTSKCSSMLMGILMGISWNLIKNFICSYKCSGIKAKNVDMFWDLNVATHDWKCVQCRVVAVEQGQALIFFRPANADDAELLTVPSKKRQNDIFRYRIGHLD